MPALGQPAPREVPLVDGEFEFIAITTPEATDANKPPTQRERVTESLIRRPDRQHGDNAKQ